jgi:LysR family transcriptional regulator, regulator for bpeEF and oprC
VFPILLLTMATMDIDQLAAFVAVVRAKSFTAAANNLGTQKAHLSRVISRLEQQFGVRLLQRSTRSLALTEVGRDVYERAAAILAAIDETEAAIQGTLSEPRGVLRLTCSVEVGILLVNGWIRSFLGEYPHVRVDAEFSNRVVDLIHEGFDLAIRVGRLPDSSLSARLLGEFRFALFANARYLQRRPEPQHPNDLASHDVIMFAPSRPATWRLVKDGERFDVSVPPRLSLDNNIAARDATVAGLGIALLPRFLAAPYLRDGQLLEVLRGWAGPPMPLHAIFPSSRYLAPKVRSFIDLATAQMPDV